VDQAGSGNGQAVFIVNAVIWVPVKCRNFLLAGNRLASQ
jgi:hypothetical protein